MDSAMWIVGTNHTSFSISDMERSLKFYRDLLGMTVISDREAAGEFASTITGLPNAHLRIVYLQIPGTGGHRLELIQYLSPIPRPLDRLTSDVGSAHLALNVADLTQTKAWLEAQGVSFKSEPLVVGGGPNQGRRAVYLLDPDGITLELIETEG